jgi:hypothetical protein
MAMIHAWKCVIFRYYFIDLCGILKQYSGFFVLSVYHQWVHVPKIIVHRKRYRLNLWAALPVIRSSEFN